MISGKWINYSDFKNAWATLGGRTRDIVLFSDNTPVSGVFSVDAQVDQVVLQFSSTTKPTTFDTDFPQAIKADVLSEGF